MVRAIVGTLLEAGENNMIAEFQKLLIVKIDVKLVILYGQKLFFWKKYVILILVALIGLEPIQTEPESAVLPLHHKAIVRLQKYNLIL